MPLDKAMPSQRRVGFRGESVRRRQRPPRSRFDSMQDELADPKRFQPVETNIRHARTGLKAVEHLEAGETVDVVTRDPMDRKRRK
jgi:hypothetical protein